MSEETDPNDFEELRAFITGSLKAIVDGIADAQQASQLTSPFGSGTHAYNAPKEVSFDIAVSAEHSKSAKGGFSLRVLSVGAGAEAEGGDKQSTATRIQFSVRTEFKANKVDVDPKPVKNNW